MPASDPFPVRHVSHVEPPPEQAWLVEQILACEACAVTGGMPKTGKTWFCCELALAVATGGPAFGRYAVPRRGNVVFYGAEDKPQALRSRLEGIARVRGVSLDDSALYFLDVSQLHINRPEDLRRLRATVEQQQPALVVLEPFVRIARVDENSASEVSAVLGELRAIQREFKTAILLAHHMRKSASGHKGYQLRGSGDFAAWHDSAHYLSGSPDDLALHIEHRSAPAPDPLRLRLMTGESPRLEIIGTAAPTAAVTDDPVQAAILDFLATASRPVSTAELRDVLRARKQTVTDALAELERSGRIARLDGGWSAVA
jgi:hypothetical protein